MKQFVLPADHRDAEAERLFGLLARSPDDDDLRQQLADRLDTLGPTRRLRDAVPDWMRVRWLSANKDRRRGSASGSSVLCEIAQVYDFLDHAGCCRVLGRLCFLTEPYDYIERNRTDAFRLGLLSQMKQLVPIVGGIPVVCRLAAHAFGETAHPWLCRGLLFPNMGQASPYFSKGRLAP